MIFISLTLLNNRNHPTKHIGIIIVIVIIIVPMTVKVLR